LYNIRRERRIEFAAEGLRLNDLKRWRALDMMQGYHVEGFDLWSENYQRYKTPSPIPVADVTLSVINLIESGNNNANVSAKSESQYLRPYRINTNNIAYNGYNWNQNKT
jgi:starch-binding outer membrane protein, SusD/RagB family